jgi:hypothetical protein
MNAMRQAELRELIEQSYQMVREKLPKKKQAELLATPKAKSRAKAKAKPLRAAKRRK